MLKITVLVQDIDGQPIEGAKVSGTFSQLTSADGIAKIDTTYITVEAEGFISYVGQPYQNPVGVIPITLTPQVDPPDPPVVTLPDLRVEGAFFKAGDELFTVIESSEFALLARWQNGEDITDTLTQRRDIGFNMLRVWTAFNIPGIGVFTTIDYSRIPAFVALCASYGCYVDFTAYTGINDPSHWTKLCDAALKCQPRPILELVNELSENTNEPDDEGRVFHLEDYHQAPAPLLSSHGSNGSQRLPVRPWWNWEAFHLNDAPEWWRKNNGARQVSEGVEEGGVVWEPSYVPVITNESTRCPDRDSLTAHYMDAAAAGALLPAGSCFHSVSGKSGRPFVGQEIECAKAHVLGAKSVDLRYQVGRYNRLDPGNFLRVYQRVLPDGSFEQVEIRK